MCRIISSTILILFMFFAVDFVVHGILLAAPYMEFQQLWRPMSEMKNLEMQFVNLGIALGVTWLYKYFVKRKSALTGTKFGLLLGIVSGLGGGFGSFTYMPISLGLAFGWFFALTIKMTFAGLIVGLIIKKCDKTGNC